MNSGIYCIENLVNGKKYIGQSQGINKRIKQHICMLKNNKKKQDNIHLKNSWDLYGEENFCFWIVEECSFELLNEREIYWIKKLHSHYTESGYNTSFGGESPMRGLHHTKDKKEQISKTLKLYGIHSGKNNPMYGKKGILCPSFGKPKSEEQKKLQSKIMKGRYAGKNNPFYGSHLSEESKRKLSKSLKEHWRKKHEEEQKNSISYSSEYEILHQIK